MNGHEVVSKIETAGLTVSLNESDQLVVDGKAPNAQSLLEIVKLHRHEVKDFVVLRETIREARILQCRIDDGGETELLPDFEAIMRRITAIEHALVGAGISMDEVAAMVNAAREASKELNASKPAPIIREDGEDANPEGQIGGFPLV